MELLYRIPTIHSVFLLDQPLPRKWFRLMDDAVTVLRTQGSHFSPSSKYSLAFARIHELSSALVSAPLALRIASAKVSPSPAYFAAKKNPTMGKMAVSSCKTANEAIRDGSGAPVLADSLWSAF